MKKTIKIPLMRPRLPEAKSIYKYLQRIDSARYYTNGGPLLREFEYRLAQHFGVDEGCVVCVCNGTLGLFLALKNLDPEPGSLCLMPSWTFVATPTAAAAAGFTPWFVDVSERTWRLDPDDVRAILPKAPGPVAAIVPVSPFGAPFDTALWSSFSNETGIDVVIDMAAGFDSCKPNRIPTIISLHATKIFSVGEGGLIATTDVELAGRIRRNSNYGFSPDARVTSRGINAKMSEYPAAIGLAGLENWHLQRSDYQALTEVYLEMLKQVDESNFAPGFGEGWFASTCNVRFRWIDADRLMREMRGKGIETRKWWGNGCHRHPAWANFPRTDLPITEMLSSSVLGLPFYPDLQRSDVDYICRALDTIRQEQRHLVQGFHRGQIRH